MILSFYILIVFLIYLFFSFVYYKRTVKNFINEELKIITGLKNKENLDNLHENIKSEYEETLNKIITQGNELENSLVELKEFRNELDVTYNTLVSKSSQLEYSNQLLEMRVKNLSNLNQISRSTLSMFDLEKIIDTVADAYFILTATRRISIYIWENGTLTNKKIKGAIDFSDNAYYPYEFFIKFTENDFNKIYADLGRNITTLNDEKLLISPLKVKNKEIGVIYIVQDKNKLLKLNKEMISALAIQASIAIENATNHSELIIKERISKELELASSMQKQILPESINNLIGYDIATYFSPAKEIGGDYYDYSLKDNIFSISMADVSGKGVPAAFLMALSRSILKTINYISTYGPAEELNLFNKIIFKDITEDMFITIMNANYDLKTNILTYSSAGHNPILIYKKETNKIEVCGTKGVAIGFIENYNYKEENIDFKNGDIAIFYTDGIIEAENNKKELFGIERLKETILNNSNCNVNELKEKILEAINNFRGEKEQNDDITFLILKSVANN
ncbi:MAG: PP2C family protein-serine/threonine phosphatase [Fusobacterium sp.]|nr:PP2C family protein-serine/threonine phosphatase [Fusobacterium sp.]